MTAWNLNHNPLAHPLGCNGKYGQSGSKQHYKAGEKACAKCRASQRHYMRELRRGQPKPRRLKPCGTWAAASRHRAKGESLDFACRVAEANYQQQRRDKKKEHAMNTECTHEVTSNQGVCLDCEQPVENWEPGDAQIPGTYEIQKAA